MNVNIQMILSFRGTVVPGMGCTGYDSDWKNVVCVCFVESDHVLRVLFFCRPNDSKPNSWTVG